MAIIVSDSKITVGPNSSLSVVDTMKLVLGLAAVSMSVGVGFALAGAWMVLPFAGLEILAIAYAFYYIAMHAQDYESIVIDENKILVEQYCYKGVSNKVDFQRYWARVILRPLENGKSGLFIGSHGKELEFGKHFLNDAQRIFLANELKQRLKSIN